MKFVTYIYKEFWGTDYTIASARRHGIEPIIVKTNDNPPDILRSLLSKYSELDCETLVYADCADSFFQSIPNPPSDRIVYQTEKACFPFIDKAGFFDKLSSSRWRYLNGGGYMGNRELIIEFFKRYGLDKIGSLNPQWAQQQAFLSAYEDGFPIQLDFNCEYYQSIAFQEPTEFSIVNKKVRNNITNTEASILHGNGRTDMKWVYELL